MTLQHSMPRLPHDTAVLDAVARALREQWRRDGISPDPDRDVDELCELAALEGPSSPRARDLLESTGVRDAWNHVFARRRSAYLAEWLTPYLTMPVLDVLAGDATVTTALARNGIPRIIGIERATAYAVEWPALTVPMVPFVDGEPLPPGPWGSLLVSTVLHHEPDLDALLHALDACDATRWVVVENCVTADYQPAFHEWLDVFFNTCLNQFDVPCVPQHRTAEQWRQVLGRYGRVVWDEERRDVPGMPFAYHVFVVDR